MKTRALRIGADVAQAAVEAAGLRKPSLKSALAFEGGVVLAKRLAKRGRYAAEDLMDEAAHRIKREPLRLASTIFAVGLGVGVMSGMLMMRNHHR